MQPAMLVVLFDAFRPGAHFWSSVRRERRKWPMPLFRFFAVSGRTERDRKLKIRGNGTYFSQRSRNRSRKSISTHFFYQFSKPPLGGSGGRAAAPWSYYSSGTEANVLDSRASRPISNGNGAKSTIELI
uniref:Uncharacterized protein n=1 Tax=Cacopsylla melanoneura TaxID=428564 RepID=A0A8D9E3A1_9HEMI